MRKLFTCVTLATLLSLTSCGPRDQDKLGDADLASGQPVRKAAPDRRCSAQSSQDEVKRQLFARAAEIRGSNADNYARIASFALLQLDGVAPQSPVEPGQTVECRARATLRLPAGLKVAGGRTTVAGEIAFSVAPGERGPVTLGQADPVAIPLATLTQNRRTPAPPVVAATPADPPVAVSDPAPVADPLAPAAAARPSFNCRSARTQGEVAVCASPTLAGLDRAMAAQYRASVARADANQGMLLRETRDRFLGYRDRCPSDSCIANTYRGRMREIDDIMANRWQGRVYRRD